MCLLFIHSVSIVELIISSSLSISISLLLLSKCVLIFFSEQSCPKFHHIVCMCSRTSIWVDRIQVSIHCMHSIEATWWINFLWLKQKKKVYFFFLFFSHISFGLPSYIGAGGGEILHSHCVSLDATISMSFFFWEWLFNEICFSLCSTFMHIEWPWNFI